MPRERHVMKNKFLFLLIPFMSLSQPVFAEGDFLRSMGKIYVVVGVLLMIFIGIVIYLISLDRKLTKLETQINENGQSN